MKLRGQVLELNRQRAAVLSRLGLMPMEARVKRMAREVAQGALQTVKREIGDADDNARVAVAVATSATFLLTLAMEILESEDEQSGTGDGAGTGS